MENHSDTDLVKLRERLMKGELRPGFEIYNGFLCYQNRYCIGSNSNLRIIILEELHNSQIGGHAGYFKTLLRIRQRFW